MCETGLHRASGRSGTSAKGVENTSLGTELHVYESRAPEGLAQLPP